MSANVMKLPISLFQRVNASLAKSVTAKEELRACAARIHAHGHRMIEDCLAIGKELLAARGITRAAYDKGAVEGEWLRFLDETVKMPRRQAQRFIAVYERYGPGAPRGAPLPDASFRVLAELAAPEADPEVVAELEKRIAKGERVTVRQAAKAKRKPKQEKTKRKTDSTGFKDFDLALAVRIKKIKREFGALGAWKIIPLIDKLFPGCDK